MDKQTSPLQQAELEKRSKELDAREAYLDERQKFIESGPIDLTVLEKTLQVRTTELKQIKQQIVTASKDFKAHEARLNESIAMINASLQASKGVLQTKNKAIREADALYNKRSTDLQTIEADIIGRTEYATEQEKLISQNMEHGNEELLSLRFQIEDMDRQKVKIVTVLADLNREKATLEDSLPPIEQKRDSLQRGYDEAAANFRQSLETVKNKIAVASQRYQQVEREVDGKLKTLKTHEDALLAKRQALDSDRARLDTEKRRWASTKSLYSVD